MCKIIGIDISKQTFDVSFKQHTQWVHYNFPNEEKGFKQLLKLIKQDDWVVMESSANYYLPLACFLSCKGIKVCVENPLIIKRYIQSRQEGCENYCGVWRKIRIKAMEARQRNLYTNPPNVHQH